jgi:hypothetical protein
MRVYCKDLRQASINIFLKHLRMWGFPHGDDPEKNNEKELWAGVTPSGRNPVIWIPMKRDPEGNEAKGEGLVSNNIRPDET